mgnify:FL=1
MNLSNHQAIRSNNVQYEKVENLMLAENPIQKLIEMPILMPMKMPKLEMVEDFTEVSVKRPLETSLLKPNGTKAVKSDVPKSKKDQIRVEKENQDNEPMTIMKSITSSEISKSSSMLKIHEKADSNEGTEILLRKPKKKANKRFECETCHEKLLIRAYKRHRAPCKLFSKVIIKMDDLYQCKLCLIKVPKRFSMYCHIRKKHSNDQDINKISSYFLPTVETEEKTGTNKNVERKSASQE